MDTSALAFIGDFRAYDMGLDETKPDFWVSNKVRLKPVSLATETS